jgi:AraC-like DNA-binding protein
MPVHPLTSEDMSQQKLMVSMHDTARLEAALPECLVLDENTPLVPVEAGLLALILHGRCVVQRLVAEHWVDQATCVNGGVVIAAGDIPVRAIWASSPDGVALVISAEAAAFHMARVVESLAPSSMMKLPCDPVIMSFAKAFSHAEPLATEARVSQHIVELMLFRIKQLGHERLLSKQPKTRALPQWRFRRVASFVQEKLDKEVSLADMAAACGLSPMYFAALFKAATGMRPHDYLIQQRIEQAKRLLLNSPASILEVALSVGFQTQAHFTTVFKRVEKTTPHNWRQSSLAA